MAVIKLQEGADSSLFDGFIDESGLIATSELTRNITSQSDEDDGSTYRQLLYSGSSLLSIYEYDYSVVTDPSPDMRIDEIRLLNADEDIIQSWSSLDVSLHEVLKTNTIPLLNEDDTFEGNSSSNVLQGAYGDDLLIGLGGDDLLDGGRADDILIGGLGNDTLQGGLGTDTAVFTGSEDNYIFEVNDNGSVSFIDIGSGYSEGTDTLHDMEWAVFNYGTENETRYSVDWFESNANYYGSNTQLAAASLNNWYNSYSNTSYISGPSTYNHASRFNGDDLYIAQGSYYNFHNNQQTISWAIANNTTYNVLDWNYWSSDYQDLIGGAFEEISKVADLNFK